MFIFLAHGSIGQVEWLCFKLLVSFRSASWFWVQWLLWNMLLVDYHKRARGKAKSGKHFKNLSLHLINWPNPTLRWEDVFYPDREIIQISKTWNHGCITGSNNWNSNPIYHRSLQWDSISSESSLFILTFFLLLFLEVSTYKNTPLSGPFHQLAFVASCVIRSHRNVSTVLVFLAHVFAFGWDSSALSWGAVGWWGWLSIFHRWIKREGNNFLMAKAVAQKCT